MADNIQLLIDAPLLIVQLLIDLACAVSAAVQRAVHTMRPDVDRFSSTAAVAHAHDDTQPLSTLIGVDMTKTRQ